jgi:hypothetical protein
LNSVSFVENIGYALYFDGSVPKLFKTVNNADTWTNITSLIPSTSTLTTIYAINRSKFVLGTSFTDSNVYSSTNSGTTLITQSKGINQEFDKFAYANSSTGFTLSNFPTIFGGTSSIARTLFFNQFFFDDDPAGSTISNYTPYDVHFNGRTGYYVGLDSSGNGSTTPSSFIWKTTDAGNNWSAVTPPNNAVIISCVRVTPNGNLFVGGHNNAGTINYISKSTNGGSTWSTLTFSPVASGYVGGGYTWAGMEFYSDLSGVIILTNTTQTEVSVTIDGGVNWNLVSGSFSSDVLAAVAVSKKPIL